MAMCTDVYSYGIQHWNNDIVGIMEKKEGRKRPGSRSDVTDVGFQLQRQHGNVTPEEDLYLYEHMQTKKSRQELKELEKQSDTQPLLSSTLNEPYEIGDNDPHEKQDRNSNKLKSMYNCNDVTNNQSVPSSSTLDILTSHQKQNSHRPKNLTLKGTFSKDDNTKWPTKSSNHVTTTKNYVRLYDNEDRARVGESDFVDTLQPETPSSSDVDGTAYIYENMTEYKTSARHGHISQSQGQFQENWMIIEHLLEQIDAEKWRRPLRSLLSVYYTEQPLRQAISFLTHMFHQAVRICQSERSIDQLIDLDVTRVPPIFNLDHWHSLVLAVGFNIEEPDTCKNISNSTVLVPVDMNPCVPEGFLLLLKSFTDLGFYDIRTLLALEKQQAHLLRQTINELSGSCPDITPWVGPLWEMHQDFLENLGFTRVRQGSRKHFTFNNNTSSKLVSVYNILCGMYGHVSEILKETFV